MADTSDAPLPSDALVFFGATGDLAYKQIFPSLLGLVRDEGLNIPIIGVAKSGWTLDQLKQRAKDSLAHHGADGYDGTRTSCCPCCATSMATMPIPRPSTNLHKELGEAKRPLHYLAVPPSLFGTVAEQLSQVRRCRQRAAGDREAVRPRPRLGKEAERHGAEVLPRGEHLPHRPLPRQGAGAEPALHALRQPDVRADLEPRPCRAASRSPWPRISACRTAAGSMTRPAPTATCCRTICCRSCRQLTMDPPDRRGTRGACATRSRRC